MARDYEKDAGKRASEHRAEVERDAEWIRQYSERQHVRDLGKLLPSTAH